MESRLKTLIVSNEYSVRGSLRQLLQAFPEIQVVGEAANAEEAFQLIKSVPYSVLFIDVVMPGTSGLDLARKVQKLDKPPWIVFTAADQEHALEAFSVNAVDYLLQPVDEGQLERALSKITFLHARSRAATRLLTDEVGQNGGNHTTDAVTVFNQEQQIQNSPESQTQTGPVVPLGRIPLHKADKTILVDEQELYFAKSDDGYVNIKLENEKLQSRYTLKELESRLNSNSFFRTHRCYLVNLHKVKELIPDFKGAFEIVMNDRQNTRIPVSRRRAKQLRHLLGM